MSHSDTTTKNKSNTKVVCAVVFTGNLTQVRAALEWLHAGDIPVRVIYCTVENAKEYRLIVEKEVIGDEE